MLLLELIWVIRRTLRVFKGLLKGKFPQFRVDYHISDIPRELETFNQKILYRMKNDRNPDLTLFANKLDTRKYVANIGLKHILPDLYWSGENLEELLGALDRYSNFVVKPSRGSGATLICSDTVNRENLKHFSFFDNPWGVYLYMPHHIRRQTVLYLASKWLREDYANRPDAFQEWGYSGPNQQIMIEEVLLDQSGTLPRDYKVFVFHGKALMIQVDYDRFNNHSRAFFTTQWELMELRCLYPMPNSIEEKPTHLEELLSYAEAIASAIDFLRVDFYITNKGVIFGETTIYPGGGVDAFTPLKLNRELGARWEIEY